MAPQVIAAAADALPGELSQTAGDADYKIALLQRTAKSSFMPDVMVFPGGSVDAQDAAVAESLVGDTAVSSVTAVAACREAFEESGIVVAEDAVALSEADCASWRERVHGDASEFVPFCREHSIRPDIGQLEPICSFITPDMEHDRLPKGGFDARFFLACCSDAAALAHAKVDETETVHLAWLTPCEALAASDRGDIALAPPQWYILNDLAACTSLADLRAHVSSPGRALALQYPIKPYVATLDAEDEAAGFETALCCAHLPASLLLNRSCKSSATRGCPDWPPLLTDPGDESHPVFPGQEGWRHRMVMAGKFGGEMKYALRRSGVDLPLRESEEASGWYTLAKL